MTESAPVIKKLGPVVIATLSSQVTSAAGLFLLPLLGLRVSDIYTIAIQTGFGSFTGICIGVVYLLAIGRPSFRHWTLFGNIAALFSMGLAAVAGVLIFRGAHGPQLPRWESITILASFGIGGAMLALAGTWAVREACNGRPLPMAGVSLVPNVGFLIAIVPVVLFFRHSPIGIVSPAIFWAITNTVLYLAVRNRVSEPAVASGEQIDKHDNRQNKLIHAAALAIGVITSTVMPTFFITATSKLRPGSTTVLFIAARIGTSLVSLGVNSVLMVQYNWLRRDESRGQFSALAMVAALSAGVVGIVCKYLWGAPIVAYAFVLVSWLGCIVAAPVVAREVHARRMGRLMMAKTLLDLLVLSGVATLLNHRPSASGYFAAYMTSQCVTTIVCGSALRNWLLVSVSVGALAVSGVFLGFGW